MKTVIRKYGPLLLGFSLLFYSCSQCKGRKPADAPTAGEMALMADTLEESLFKNLLSSWYPGVIDGEYGGYVSSWNYDWTLSDGPQLRSLVQQARHVWATSFIFENYPAEKEYLGYASGGMKYLCTRMWDTEYGGFEYSCHPDGGPDMQTEQEKRVYGQAFALFGLAQYYRMSGDTAALECMKKAFLWMEEHAHDPVNGGYYEFLKRDGSVMRAGESNLTNFGDARVCGLKDYNSAIHLMEALEGLYRAWPDPLVKERMEEMFYLVRDVFVHPGGYLQLYFYPDWTPVPDDSLVKNSPGDYYYTSHFSYGHDVETAYLLLETARTMGMEEDKKTRELAKKLVDHALDSGWDKEKGGFFGGGKMVDGELEIVDAHKSWWAQAEGMNALLMMHTLYPGDERNYYGKFLEMWKYIDTYLVDRHHGEWYNYGLDTDSSSRLQNKSHPWKTSYHNCRAMVNCIRMLRGED